MKDLFLCLLISLFPITAFAQDPSPDFLITDSDNMEHQLYANHLDQGQAVLIEIFFTTCPPCNAISPLMEPFYQEWGGGSGMVEFFSLSNKAFDNNTDVATYRTTYGHTFPSAGNDGGSLDAIVPYTDGTYGFFIGTPTFIIIAPDGEVTYNPFGVNTEARFHAIDAALRATGVSKPAIPHQITGSIVDIDTSGIPNVDVIFPEIDTLPEASNEAGNFEVSANLVSRDSYILKARKNDNYRERVSIRDLVKIHQHILGVKTFDSPHQLLAADADHSGSVTTQDLLKLRKLILHIENELAANDSWLFIDADYEFENPANPFPEVYDTQDALLHFTANETTEFHLLGIKIGDIH